MENALNFTKGCFVQCEGFRGAGEVVDGPNQRNEYLVVLGNIKVWVKAEKMKPASSGKPKDDKKPKAKNSSGSDKTGEPLRIDLHGLKADEARRMLEQCLDQAILSHAPKVEVIHGIGRGTLRNVVSEFCQASSHISKFQLDERNPGTTWIFL